MTLVARTLAIAALCATGTLLPHAPQPFATPIAQAAQLSSCPTAGSVSTTTPSGLTTITLYYNPCASQLRVTSVAKGYSNSPIPNNVTTYADLYQNGGGRIGNEASGSGNTGATADTGWITVSCANFYYGAGRTDWADSNGDHHLDPNGGNSQTVALNACNP